MKYVKMFVRLLKILAGLSLLGMMLLTCADVVGSIFGYPIMGAEEMVALWASILLAFSLPAAQIDKANVGVDFLYLKLPGGAKKINDIFITLLSFVLFSLISWRCFLYAKALHASGEVTMTLQLPSYLLVYAISYAMLILALVLLFELIAFFRSGESTCQNQ